MSLGQRQRDFALHVGRLIARIYASGYACTFGDAYRDPAVAEVYATLGKGIKNSLHSQRLAIDLNLFRPIDGTWTYLADSEEYRLFGEWWEGLHPDARWGGRFAKPDGNHFSFGHEGRA